MTYFSVSDAQAWAESTKLPVTTIDPALETAVVNIVFSHLRPTFDTATWISVATTPSLIRTILAMYYIAALYDKHYAQEEEAAAYANTLRGMAMANIAGLLAGNITLVEYEIALGTFEPSFFPNDLSSANPASADFPSDGGPAFVMGSVF